MIDYSRLLKQTITHWGQSSVDEYNEKSFNAPTTFIGRFENVIEEDIEDTSRHSGSDALIYTDTNIGFSVGDYLFIGTSLEADPLDVEDSYTIKKINSIPSITGNQTLFTLEANRVNQQS